MGLGQGETGPRESPRMAQAVCSGKRGVDEGTDRGIPGPARCAGAAGQVQRNSAAETPQVGRGNSVLEVQFMNVAATTICFCGSTRIVGGNCSFVELIVSWEDTHFSEVRHVKKF